MPESSLAKKIKIKPGQRIAVVNAPEGYLKELSPLPAGVEVSRALKGKFDWIQVIARSKKDKALPTVPEEPATNRFARITRTSRADSCN